MKLTQWIPGQGDVTGQVWWAQDYIDRTYGGTVSHSAREHSDYEWERNESARIKDRSEETQQSLKWFNYGHLPEGKPRSVSAQCAGLAISMIQSLPDGSELTTGLRKLREAKDCFVFLAVQEQRDK
jgi:hypothetical protein